MMMHAGGICLTFLASICVSSSTETLYISYEDQRGSTGMIAGSAILCRAMLSDSKKSLEPTTSRLFPCSCIGSVYSIQYTVYSIATVAPGGGCCRHEKRLENQSLFVCDLFFFALLSIFGRAYRINSINPS
jgi:hypothetical protein